MKKHILYHPKKSDSNDFAELDFTYFNAIYTVENALAKVKDEKGMKRVEKFLKEDICPDCHGTRLSAAARAPKLQGISLDEACAMTLSELVVWVKGVPQSLPEEMRPMAQSICEAFQATAKRLMDLGLGYLTLDRSASTLSTGERQRMQLARAVRNRTTGVLYVLDEPSIGLHPSNIVGLTGVLQDLVADGNSVILVDHDTQILKESDWLIEMGPEAGAKGGHIIAQGNISTITADPASQIGPFLSGTANTRLRPCIEKEMLFTNGRIHLSTDRIHTVNPLEVDIPKGRLTVVTGVSGSGKTTLMNIVGCLDLPTSGTYILDGRPVSELKEKELTRVRRDTIGFVFQNFQLMPRECALDNVCLPLIYAGVSKKDRRQMGMEALERVGLSDRADFRPTQLSGGQKQRVAIARAMVNHPKLLLADEPTGALDSKSGKQVLELFESLNESGVTVVVITHDRKVAEQAKRIVHIIDGEITEEGQEAGNEKEKEN